MPSHDIRYATAFTATAILCPFGAHLAGLALHPKQVRVGDEVFCHGCQVSLVIESVQVLPGGTVVGVRQRFPWEGRVGEVGEADGQSKASEVGEEREAASGATD